MGDSGVSEDDIIGQIDWEHLLDDIPEDMNLFAVDDLPPVSDPSADASAKELSNPSPDSVSSWIGEIEHLLMNDDDDNHTAVVEPNHQICNDFLSDILLDSPGEADRCGEVVDASNDKSWNVSDDGGSEKDKIDVSEKENNNGGDDDDDEDHISKKRKRQLRNRDAAVRSRERKKMYVRDLEMKSRYLEGECRRLGRLLQCCYAENHALRLSLHKGKAFDASMSKQESAVLLLESLLLGSLLWFLGIMCLLPLPRLLRSVSEAVSLENVDHKEDQGSLAPRRARSKISGFWVLKSFIMSKRCKASRTKMKPSSLIYEVLV